MSARRSMIERVTHLNKSNRTEGLDQYGFLAGITPDELPGFLRKHRNMLMNEPRLFAAYMRAKFKEKEVLQQNVFLAADISENYGYKLIAEEKHTVNRDIILRICIGAGFRLDETQEALIRYGMAPLYHRIPRDIVFIVAIRNGLCDIYQINDLLIRCALAPMF